ncbi:hypothetical protein F4679DRAFT_539677 [Xylaria curta]|nr:hypothetical protein F4679DRAFT_539677 [Xylaria curta]
MFQHSESSESVPLNDWNSSIHTQRNIENDRDQFTTSQSHMLTDSDGGLKDIATDEGNGADARLMRTSKSIDLWRTLALDILLALLVLPFLFLASFSLSADGRLPDRDSSIVKILELSRYGSTIFPLLFSTIVGRLMKSIETFKLERGATTQILEQLHGSRTVISAVVTQYQLHVFNLASLAIIVLWAVSPIGSQASLYIGEIRSINESSLYGTSYFDPRSRYNPYDFGYSIALANSIFTTSLSLPLSAAAKPQDPWGNIKVPLIEALEDSPSLEWLPIDDESHITYSSLIGIPVQNPDTDSGTEGNITTYSQIETTYWWVNCGSAGISNNSAPFPDTVISIPSANWTHRLGFDDIFRQVGNVDFPPNSTQQSRITLGGFPWVPRKLYLSTPDRSNNWKAYFNGICNITTTWVTVNTTCFRTSASSSTSSCQATGIRRSLVNETLSTLTMLDYSGVDRPSLFLRNLLWSTYSGFPVDPAFSADVRVTAPETPPLFGYMADPSNPGVYQREPPDWSPVTLNQLSTRITQLLNSYWAASIGYSPIQGNFNNSLEQPGLLNGAMYKLLNGSETAVVTHTAFVANKAWCTVLILASLVLLVASGATAVLGTMRNTPDILDNFSTLLKDNQFVDGLQTSPGENRVRLSSMADGFERSRHLRSVLVRIGDVTPLGENGYVAITTLKNDAVSRLVKNRKYI